jgi:hypothetical protein
MIFKQFQPTDIVAGRIQTVTEGMWTNANPILSDFFTSSLQTVITGSSAFEPKNGLYYWNVYDKDPQIDDTALVQFAVTFGNRFGSGSLVSLASGSVLPTQAIYTQYKNLLLNPTDAVFTFVKSGSTLGGVDSDSIYVINLSTTQFKEKIDIGRTELHLSGSKGLFSFVDDSTTTSSFAIGTSGRVFNIVSGSIVSGSIATYDSQGRGFGLLYPDVGVMVLHPAAIADVVGDELSGSLVTDHYAVNQQLLYSAIEQGGNFQARSVEFIPTRHYFVRVGNQESNYSNNPTFIINDPNSPNFGQLRFAAFANDPQVYITTVGLYNDNNDLIAVAKLSQPLLKTFDSEALIRIRLSW